jgi:glycerol-3-phosphate acyltransferase PlsY
MLLAIAAIFVVLGHMFPAWLKFRGGKGVATAVGVYLALAPKPLGFSFLVFLLVFAATRYVSLASMLSALSFPLFFRWIEKMSPTQPVFISALAIALLIVVKHHSNIRRLLKGTESRLGKKPAEALAGED